MAKFLLYFSTKINCRSAQLLLLGYLGPHTGYLQWDTEDRKNADERIGVFPDG